jgi:hypothetical protein
MRSTLHAKRALATLSRQQKPQQKQPSAIRPLFENKFQFEQAEKGTIFTRFQPVAGGVGRVRLVGPGAFQASLHI